MFSLPKLHTLNTSIIHTFTLMLLAFFFIKYIIGNVSPSFIYWSNIQLIINLTPHLHAKIDSPPPPTHTHTHKKKREKKREELSHNWLIWKPYTFKTNLYHIYHVLEVLPSLVAAQPYFLIDLKNHFKNKNVP